ncbi:MAG: nucleotidyltransferase substrate binding protein [Ignavibacteriales bacterium]|nr:nucleotidyltransferase substrate binding protein [Ignavibacteriales bacterium]
MDPQDTRWDQRNINLNKAVHLLQESIKTPEPEIVVKAGIIQFFEMSFELAWKTLRDYLEEQGFTEVATPRSAIKKAFEVGLITDGHIWMQALEDRNLALHTYDEHKATEMVSLIRNKYVPILQSLIVTLNLKR